MPALNYKLTLMLCCIREFDVFRCCHIKQLTTTNTVLLSTNYCAKTKETPVYQLLRAHVRIFDFG